MATSHPEFNNKTQAQEVVAAFPESVRAKTILITGVSPNGLGAEMALALAAVGPELLILTGRTLSKVDAVRESLKAAFPNVATRALQLDLASLSSVRKAAAEVVAPDQPGIDILINNAGVMNVPTRTLTVDGNEMQLGTNHLGPWLFTRLIEAALIRDGGARVVNLSSNAWMFGPFRFSDCNFESNESLPQSERPDEARLKAIGETLNLGYTPLNAYAQSKTANILHVVGLNKRLQPHNVTAVAVHPGDLWRHMPEEATKHLHSVLPMKSLSEGVSTPLVAALDPKLAGGKISYLEDCQECQTDSYAVDPELADKLWKLSEQMVETVA